MRRYATFVAIAATALAVAACGSASTAAPDMSHVGLYDMTSVDGDPLPTTVIDMPGYTLQVTDGSLQLNANSTFAESMTTVETIDGAESPLDAAVCLGSYTRKGNIITLTTPETDTCIGQRVTGTLSGSKITVDYDGTAIVFTR